MKAMLERLQPSLSTLAYRAACVALTLVMATCLALLVAGRAHAAPTVAGEFQLTGKPERVAAGPDGNMWVTLSGSSAGNEVARVAPDGAVQEFDVAKLANAIGITAGPDGNMWVTRPTLVARFAPQNPAGAEELAAGNIAQAQTIATGPDGNLWTASADKAIRITPAGVVTDFPITGLAGARGIASSGGLLWVADFANGKIFSVTTAGVGTPHDVGGNGPQEVAGGPNGQVAYGNPGTDPQTVGRLVAGGSPLTTPTPAADPFGVAFGTDGAYWFAQFAGNDLGRLTPDGAYTTLAGFSAGAGPRYIAAGPGNTLWVALTGVDVNKVARVTGVEPSQPISAIAPAIAKLRLAPKAFRVGAARTPVAAQKRRKGRRAPVGTTIRFSLSEAATVRISIARRLTGRRSGRRCVAPRPRLRSHRRCTRHVKRGRTLVRRDLAAGARRIPFSGRIGRRALRPSHYRLTAVATAAKRRSKARHASFEILAPRR